MTIEENSAAIDGVSGKTTSRQPQPSKIRGFLTFLFDRKNGTVLGRTGRSWCKFFIFSLKSCDLIVFFFVFFSVEITVFYIIFYSCLAGFFAVNMAVFLYTLDPAKPRYYGKGSIIGINPGKSFVFFLF